jgi:CheY-like chemotaxis protein
VYRFERPEATANGSFQWRPTGSTLIPNITPRCLHSSHGFTPRSFTLEVAWDWRFAKEAWRGTSGVFGWSPRLAEDPPSPSQFLQSEAPAAESSEALAAKQLVHTILLVEDNSSDVYVIRQVLKRSGMPVSLQVAVDGEEALSLIQETDEQGSRPVPSMVLLDWNLPRASGAEVLSELRKSDRWKDVPVVIVTSTSSPAEIAEMDRLGAAAHFRKPTDLDAYLGLADLIRLTLSKAAEE